MIIDLCILIYDLNTLALVPALRAGIIHNDKSRHCVSLPLVDVACIIIILHLIGGQYTHYTCM